MALAMNKYTLVDCPVARMIEEENFMAQKVLHKSDDPREIIAYVCNKNLNAHCGDLTVICRSPASMAWMAYPRWARMVRFN